MDLNILKLIFAFIIVFFTTFVFNILRAKGRYILIIIKTFPRDLQLIYRVLKSEIFITFCIWRDYTILHYFYFNCKKRPNDIAFIGIEGRDYTFREFEDESNKIARYFESQGYKAGDCVGLLMESTPEYVLCWYALGKIRVITSFLNTNLMPDQLMHCINISKCNGIIFDKPLESL
uniref:Long-chain-fatty-acid--CoA ligase n=1 Tax=Myxobolus squamalis TaxID=59785 RepID=A0A6B2G2V4_MYXSQ